MTNEEGKRIKEKLDFFMDEKIKIHIKLIDKTFLNGFIKKKLREGTYWFIDNKLNGVYLFLRDIYEVCEFKEKDGGSR